MSNTYSPIQPVNIGVGRDTVNDFARKYNLEILNIYELLEGVSAGSNTIKFTSESPLWTADDNSAVFTIAHNGRYPICVFKTVDGVSSMAFVDVKVGETNIEIESDSKFDGYILTIG